MSIKRFTIFTVVLAMMALFAGMVVSAQDDTTTGKRGGRGFRGHSEVVLEATGLTAGELHEALRNGSTLAELIEANGGDVNSVVASLVQEATDHINEHLEAGDITQEQADERLAGLEDNITSRLNGTFERPEGADGFGRQGRRGGRRGHGDFNGTSPETTPDTDDATDADA